MQVRNAVWLPWLPQFQLYDGIKSRKSELHAVWLIVSMTTTDWKGEKKESHPTSFTGSGREDVEEHLRHTPRWFFFPPLSFIFTVLTQRWVYTLSVTMTGLFNIKCTETQSNIITKCKSSLDEAREDDRWCLVKTAPFSCVSLIKIQFSVILYKNIINTLWYILKMFWILAVNYLANYQPGFPVFCV